MVHAININEQHNGGVSPISVGMDASYYIDVGLCVVRVQGHDESDDDIR